MSDINFTGDMQRLKIKKGDVFVLTIDHRISKQVHDEIQTEWETIFPDNKLVVLEKGTDLKVFNSDGQEKVGE